MTGCSEEFNVELALYQMRQVQKEESPLISDVLHGKPARGIEPVEVDTTDTTTEEHQMYREGCRRAFADNPSFIQPSR